MYRSLIWLLVVAVLEAVVLVGLPTGQEAEEEVYKLVQMFFLVH
jgi:hypothetical protein